MNEVKLRQKFRKFYIYRNEINYYIVCSNKAKDQSKIIIISRLNAQLDITIPTTNYTLVDAFKFIAKALQSSGNSEQFQKPSAILMNYFVAKSYRIIGFPKFLDGYYIYFVTKRQRVGRLLGGDIFKVEEAKLEMLLNQEQSCLYKITNIKSSEIKYLEYFNSIDYHDFYFSYELDLTNRLQNLSSGIPKLRSRYVWNTSILETFFEIVNFDEFILPIILGYVEIQPFKIGIKDIKIGVISRRCVD